MSGAASNVSIDSSLLSAVRSGDEHAMAQVYERYSAIVYSGALRILGDTGAAEDVLQEVFMQLWRSPEVFDASKGSLAGWLAVIAFQKSFARAESTLSAADTKEWKNSTSRIVLFSDAGCSPCA